MILNIDISRYPNFKNVYPTKICHREINVFLMEYIIPLGYSLSV